MRKEYSGVLRDLFTAAMREKFPWFDAVKIKGNPYVWPGERIFLWKPRESIECYVILSISHQYDEFFVSVGWSKLNRFPQLGRGALRPSSHREEFSENEYLVKATYLCGDRDDWGVSSMTRQGDSEFLPDFDDLMQSQMKPITRNEAKGVVQPIVHDVMKCLEHYGIPYLEEFIASTD